MKEYVGCKVKKTGKKSLIMYQNDLINKIEKEIRRTDQKHARIRYASRKW